MAVEMSNGECKTPRELFEKFMKASGDQENVADIELQPVKNNINDASIAEHPLRDELQKAIEEHVELRNEHFRNASEDILYLTNERIISDFALSEFIRANHSLFENNTILALACAMAEEAQKQTDEYVRYVQNQFTKRRENMLTEVDCIINDVLEKVRNDAGTIDLDTRMGEAIQSIRLITAETSEKLYLDRDSLMDDVTEKADKVDAAYKEMLKMLEAQRSAAPELAPVENYYFYAIQMP